MALSSGEDLWRDANDADIPLRNFPTKTAALVNSRIFESLGLSGGGGF